MRKDIFDADTSTSASNQDKSSPQPDRDSSNLPKNNQSHEANQAQEDHKKQANFRANTSWLFKFKRCIKGFFRKDQSLQDKQKRCQTLFNHIFSKKALLSLRVRLMLVVAVSAFIGTSTMGFISYFKAYNATRDFIDEELSQIASVAINYRMTIPRRWEFPKQKREKMIRLKRQADGSIVLHLSNSQDDLGLEICHDNNVMERLDPSHGMGMGHGRGPRMGYGMSPDMVPPSPPPSQPTEEESFFKSLWPSLADIHDLNYDIIIAPLYGRPSDALYIPPGVNDGFYTLLVANERVRAVVATNITGQRFVVARPLKSLDVITTQSIISAIWLFFVIYFVSLPIIYMAFRLMFATLNHVANSLHQRAEDDLSPIVVEKGFIPNELDGFITAINRLFIKVNDGIQSKQRFIADAAHEMRTPLTALSLQVDALAKEEDLSPKAKEKVRRLKEGISRERELMTALLTLAREQNKNTLMPETINIFDLYIKIIEEQGLMADDKNIDLGVEGEANYDLVTDRSKLLRIMTNLVSNAIKYTPEDGRIDLSVEVLSDGALRLVVQDDGPGIPPEHLEHIMEPFYRVHGDCSEVQGTGLGLAIVKASCESLGAKLEFKNVEPHGLRASVTLNNIK